MRKIVSFSLWGTNLSYFNGVSANFDLIKEYLPDYQMVVHIDRNFNQFKLLEIKQMGIQTIEEENLGPFHGVYWRFFSCENRGITLFRDLDSRISKRESELIREWELSNRMFHLIRDCDGWHVNPIMAGMWGINGSIPNIRSLISRYGKFEKYGDEEIFLKDYIFPLIGNDCLEHTSMEFHSTTSYIRIPKSEDGSFIGQKIQ